MTDFADCRRLRGERMESAPVGLRQSDLHFALEVEHTAAL